MIKKRRAAVLVLLRLLFTDVILIYFTARFLFKTLIPVILLSSLLVYILCLIWISELYLKNGAVIVIKKGWVFKKTYSFKRADIISVSIMKSPLLSCFGLCSLRFFLKGFSVSLPFCDCFSAEEMI